MVDKQSNDDTQVITKQTLVETDKYLKTGSHIGTKFKTGDMSRYIYKVRKDGLKVLDVEKLDERIAIAAKFIATYKSENVVVVARKLYAISAVKKFAEIVGAKALVGRFVPGTFTNPCAKNFLEPKLVIVTDPESDFQALKEAKVAKAPVISLASTNNTLTDVDLAIPINNKGRKSLALVYWLLAREVLKANDSIKDNSLYNANLEDFEYEVKEERKKHFTKRRGPPRRGKFRK